jgi:hypothetical protein
MFASGHPALLAQSYERQTSQVFRPIDPNICHERDRAALGTLATIACRGALAARYHLSSRAGWGRGGR